METWYEAFLYGKQDLSEYDENGYIGCVGQGFRFKVDDKTCIPNPATFEFMGEFGQDQKLKKPQTMSELWDFLRTVIWRIKDDWYNENNWYEDASDYLEMLTFYKDICLEQMGRAA